MKPNSSWGEAHIRLKRLYDQRVPNGMSQRDFGKLHGIGSQSMVAQYLNGTRPLNYDAAAAFAAALGCTISDISPEMAEAIRHRIVPYLGKALRRAAMVLLPVALWFGAPQDASARFNNNEFAPQYFGKCMREIHIVRHWFSAIARTLMRLLGRPEVSAATA